MFEIDSTDSILCDVLCLQLKLEWVGFLFTHAVLEASLAIRAQSGHDEEISLSCSENVEAITTDFNRFDWITQAREQSLRVLAYLLVQSNLAIVTSEGNASSHGCAHRTEQGVSLVRALSCDTVFRADSWINCKHIPFADTLEKLTCGVLGIFEFVDNHFNSSVSKFVAHVEFISDLPGLQVVVNHSVLVVLIDE